MVLTFPFSQPGIGWNESTPPFEFGSDAAPSSFPVGIDSRRVSNRHKPLLPGRARGTRKPNRPSSLSFPNVFSLASSSKSIYVKSDMMARVVKRVSLFPQIKKENAGIMKLKALSFLLILAGLFACDPTSENPKPIVGTYARTFFNGDTVNHEQFIFYPANTYHHTVFNDTCLIESDTGTYALESAGIYMKGSGGSYSCSATIGIAVRVNYTVPYTWDGNCLDIAVEAIRTPVTNKYCPL